MNAKILLVGAAATLLTAGASQAATSRHGGGAYAEPAQPVPYSQLKAYMKASPRERASKDWSAGMTTASAATGTAADTSATMPAAPAAAPAAPAAQGPVNPPAQDMPAAAPAAPASAIPGQPVNPPTAAPAAASPATP